jgi:ParB family chromosome partitioning protein
MHRNDPGVTNVSSEEIRLVDPFRCRMWSLNDRLPEYLTEKACRSEIESFQRDGQLIPALGRPVNDDPSVDIELIYGSRRLFVARHLRIPLKIRVRKITDRDALIAMDIENRQRRDISPYERGLSYRNWLNAGLFQSQDELARALSVSASQVSRFLRLSTLPAVLLSAFGSPLEIAEGWGVKLANAWDDPQNQATLAARARTISKTTPRPPARKIFESLIAPVSKTRNPDKQSDVVVDKSGHLLFRIVRRRTTITLIIPNTPTSLAALGVVRDTVTSLLSEKPADFASAVQSRGLQAGAAARARKAEHRPSDVRPHKATEASRGADSASK